MALLVTRRCALRQEQKPDGVRALRYFSLKCIDCDLVFTPLVATSEDEIIRPDYEDMAATAGPFNTERFQDFYSEHLRHTLDCVEV